VGKVELLSIRDG
jgi:hypothetical protein